jgi:hypothetical protein
VATQGPSARTPSRASKSAFASRSRRRKGETREAVCGGDPARQVAPARRPRTAPSPFDVGRSLERQSAPIRLGHHTAQHILVGLSGGVQELLNTHGKVETPSKTGSLGEERDHR